MAKVRGRFYSVLAPLLKRGVTLLMTATFTGMALTAQNVAEEDTQPRRIEILSYGSMSQDSRIDSDRITLRDDVAIEHNQALMWCDSAYFYDAKNRVIAFGNIRMSQGDTLNLYGDYLEYDGNTEKAFVEGNVVLIDKETHLYSDILNYDLKERVAYYDQGGKIVDGENTLTSTRGTYYSIEKVFHFSELVTVTGPDFFVTADTMNYHNERELVVFTGPTTVEGDSIFIYGHQGWYDMEESVSKIWDNAIVNNMSQEIMADTIYYEELTGFGRARGDVRITDMANNSVVTGGFAIYYREPEDIMITDIPSYEMMGDTDTLYMHADTLRAITLPDYKEEEEERADPIREEEESEWNPDPDDPPRLVKGYYNTRIFSNDFQSICDSLSYSFRDSTITMFGSPVIWSEENQLTADSITIFMSDNRIDRMELYHNAFVISEVDSGKYNQTRGRFITGHFRDNNLYRVEVEGNGESIYYLVESDGLVGVNYSKSASIEIMVEGSKVLQVTEFGNPDGTLDPPGDKDSAEYKLQGFRWLDYLRPTDRYDIFRRM